MASLPEQNYAGLYQNHTEGKTIQETIVHYLRYKAARGGSRMLPG